MVVNRVYYDLYSWIRLSREGEGRGGEKKGGRREGRLSLGTFQSSYPCCNFDGRVEGKGKGERGEGERGEGEEKRKGVKWQGIFMLEITLDKSLGSLLNQLSIDTLYGQSYFLPLYL